jgi:hypothetical protein
MGYCNIQSLTWWYSRLGLLFSIVCSVYLWHGNRHNCDGLNRDITSIRMCSFLDVLFPLLSCHGQLLYLIKVCRAAMCSHCYVTRVETKECLYLGGENYLR